MHRIAYAVTCGLTAVGLAACGGAPAAQTPSATADCGDVEFPSLQAGSHLIGDAEPPIPYATVPPTSGWHRSGAPPVGIFTDPLPETAQVSTLEAGGVVVTYNLIGNADLAELSQVVGEEFPDRVAMTSYDALPESTVAFTSWGAVQRCEALDTAALAAYVTAYSSPIQIHQ